MTPFRLAIVGLGKIARDQHLPIVARNGDFDLAAVVSSRPAGLRVPSFGTMAELLASGVKLDAVSLCVPPGPRYGMARQALDAGLHVLLEKPPVPTVGELDALAAHAAGRGRVLFTTWHSQYNAAVDEARRLLAGATVTELRIVWKEDVRYWHPGQEWIWEPGGFGVFDLGINAFSIVTKILPQAICVESCTLETPRNRATPIAALIRFKPSWPGEAELSADLDWRQTGEPTWDIIVRTADGLALTLRKGGAELYVNDVLSTVAPWVEYAHIYQHFARLLRAGTSFVDVAPLRLVADCFMLARHAATAAFL